MGFKNKYTETCTSSSTNHNLKPLTLKDIQEALKAIAIYNPAEDKALGLQAMNLRYNHPEDYKKLSNEDKSLINNAVERRAYLIRQELIPRNPI